MITRILALLFAFCLPAIAATPSYKAFIGAGGITVTSNPPNGTIVIDGTAISAGALPDYAITNEQAGVTFTNKADLRQEGDVVGISGDFWTLPNITLLSGNVFEFGGDAAPTTGAGRFAWDNNAWAGGRGALQFNDGTANTYLIGVLASDTPSSGQVLMFNSGGTITWEEFIALSTFLTSSNDLAALASGGVAPGSSSFIPFNQGGAFDATNRLVYDRTNEQIYIKATSATGFLGPTGVGTIGNTVFNVAINSANVWTFNTDGAFAPAVGDAYNLGASAKRIATVYSASNNVSSGISTPLLNIAGTSPGLFGLASTNGVNTYIKAGASNSVLVTNIVGLVHRSAASVMALDWNLCQDLSVTNRIAAATTIVNTNTADGQTSCISIIGEAASGTDRVVTIIPMLGDLIVDGNNFATAPALSYSFTLTNGYMAEIWQRTRRLLGTNTMDIALRLKKY